MCEDAACLSGEGGASEGHSTQTLHCFMLQPGGSAEGSGPVKAEAEHLVLPSIMPAMRPHPCIRHAG